MQVPEQVKKVAEEIVKSNGLQLIELKIQQHGRVSQLRLTVDKSGGVLLDECAIVNILLDKQLQDEKIIGGNYSIEVISPGLDREFNAGSDFRRHIGKKVQVITCRPIDRNQVFIGFVMSVDEEKVLLEVGGSEQMPIRLDNVKKAKLKIRW